MLSYQNKCTKNKTTGVSDHLLDICGPMQWISLASGLCITWTVVAMALGFGAAHADFKEENRAATLSGFGAFLFLFCALSFALVCIALGGVPAYTLDQDLATQRVYHGGRSAVADPGPAGHNPSGGLGFLVQPAMGPGTGGRVISLKYRSRMGYIRRGFYLMAGFSFPIFWMLHAGGLLQGLYRPLQLLFHTEASGWPSFLSASLLYLVVCIAFELLLRSRPDCD